MQPPVQCNVFFYIKLWIEWVSEFEALHYAVHTSLILNALHQLQCNPTTRLTTPLHCIPCTSLHSTALYCYTARPLLHCTVLTTLHHHSTARHCTATPLLYWISLHCIDYCTITVPLYFTALYSQHCTTTTLHQNLHCITTALRCTSPYNSVKFPYAASATLHPSTPLLCTRYASLPLLHCISLHPHCSVARCSALQCTSSALHAICISLHLTSIALHWTVHTALHVTARCRAIHCIVFCYTSSAPHFTAWCSAVLHTALYFTALHVKVQCSTLHCILQHFTSIARHCMLKCYTLQCNSMHGVVQFTPLHFTARLQWSTPHFPAPPWTLHHCTVKWTSLCCSSLHCNVVICSCTVIM